MSQKIYPVPDDWKKSARIDEATYRRLYERSLKDPRRLLGRAGAAHRLDHALLKSEAYELRHA